MADNTEKLLVDTLIRLCDEKPLKKITLSELLKEADISRTAFNNRFQDMNHLISHIWLTRIVLPSWSDLDATYEDYYLSCLLSNKRKLKYKNFVIQAFEMNDQNNLREFAVNYTIDFDRQLFKGYVDSGSLTPTQAQFIATYYAYGIVELLVDWLRNGAKETPEEMARMMTDARYGMMLAQTNIGSNRLSDTSIFKKASGK